MNTAIEPVPAKNADEKYCSECGAVIKARAEICPKCGVRQFCGGVMEGKNRIMAALLALFLGGFGIHKFYLGRVGQGILYLLFFWTLIPSLIALIEAIVYLCMSDAEFAAKYNDKK